MKFLCLIAALSERTCIAAFDRCCALRLLGMGSGLCTACTTCEPDGRCRDARLGRDQKKNSKKRKTTLSSFQMVYLSIRVVSWFWAWRATARWASPPGMRRTGNLPAGTGSRSRHWYRELLRPFHSIPRCIMGHQPSFTLSCTPDDCAL